MTDVFEYYDDHQQQIDKYITPQEKKKLIDELMMNIVFEKFNPANQKLTITKEFNGNKTYTTHSWIHIYGDCIQLAAKLNLDVSKYQSKLISYIPFAYDSHLKAILGWIRRPTSVEISTLIQVYRGKTSDLWRHQPESFIKACKE